MPGDISDILGEWEYNPENTVRIIKAKDGREVLQVRQLLGIEQYEMDGRPDGRLPSGKQNYFEVVQGKLSDSIMQYADDKHFSLSHEDFILLQNEGILYYYRYLQLFQLGDFERTIRDTAHNLSICELVEKYSKEGEDTKVILQYKPYILRMNAISKAMLSLHKNLKLLAKETLETAISMITEMPEIDTPAFKFEKIRSLSYLKSALTQIIENKETSAAESLKLELEAAVADEDYEEAAKLRDRLNEMNESGE